MDLSFTEDDQNFQEEVREWLKTAWSEDLREKQGRSAMGHLAKQDLVKWQKRLAERGWAAPNWPEEFGGAGFSPNQNYIFDMERARVGAPGVVPFGITMVAPVIMKFGSEKQKQY